LFEEPGVRGRLIVGDALGLRSSVRAHSPIFYVHWELERGARAEVAQDYSEQAIYVASGSVEFDGRTVSAGQMAVLAPNAAGAMVALEPSVVMTLGGEPVGPRFIEWNFVSSSQDRIEQAKADWRAGRMKLPDLDNEEFIPLPPDPVPPPNPMS
jgi:redox-sensitive bicupin YhaK (pirin superfamily)